MDSHNLPRPVNILVVEDSPSDVRLIREALRDSQLGVHLNVAHDGAEAADFLEACKNGLYPLPDLVLLDLNLPKKNGREVLAYIKGDPLLKKVPVIVMTSSNNEDDIAAVYRLNANCYIRKPAEFFEYERVVRSIEDFWLMTVLLPDCHRVARVSSGYDVSPTALQ